MSAARRSDGLLPQAAFLKAVELVRAGTTDRDHLVEALRGAAAAPKNLAQNTIDLLIEIGVLEPDPTNSSICLTVEPDESDPIRRMLTTAYLAMLEHALPSNAFQLDPDEPGLRVNRAHLPGRDRWYPYALLEFRIFYRSGVADQFWTVSEDVAPLFMDRLSKVNTAAPTRLFSLTALKAAQEARETVGRAAEEWAVGWERQRLAGHPFQDQIRSISDENAAEGFDILSFDSVWRLVHDRFIEVKSYSGEYSFYWSEGEMESARRLGMRYWLYLVDRTQIEVDGYQPEIIQDPVSYFLDRNPIGWIVTAQSMKFTRI